MVHHHPFSFPLRLSRQTIQLTVIMLIIVPKKLVQHLLVASLLYQVLETPKSNFQNRVRPGMSLCIQYLFKRNQERLSFQYPHLQSPRYRRLDVLLQNFPSLYRCTHMLPDHLLQVSRAHCSKFLQLTEKLLKAQIELKYGWFDHSPRYLRFCSGAIVHHGHRQKYSQHSQWPLVSQHRTTPL